MDPQKRKSQILACAREVFAEKGYHRSSVADIIERAGVARGTFYLYFPSKRAIFEQLVDELLDVLQSRIKRVDVSSGPAQVLRELNDNLDAILGTMIEDRALARILFHEAVGLDEGFDEKLGQFYGTVHVLLDESLELGQQMGLIRPLDTRLVARFLLGSVKELMFDLTLSGETIEDVTGLRDELLRFYLRGIADPAIVEQIYGTGGGVDSGATSRKETS